jgi:hypothetical protein
MKRNPSQITITGGNRWYNFKDRNEVPKKVLRENFSHLDENEAFDGFLRYKKRWYHTSDFTVSPIKGWDGIAHDGYFSGVLLKMSRDGEQYKMATYYS